MSSTRLPRLAVLIDAENVGHKVAAPLMLRLAALGDPIVRRVYGDLSPEAMKGWRDAVRTEALTPCPQYGGVGGKNAADMALAIGAMDLLHSGMIDAFCLVTSDGDFTGLALRLREAGRSVYGVGGPNAPAALRAAYREFIPIEDLLPVATTQNSAPAPKPAPAPAPTLVDRSEHARQFVEAALRNGVKPDGTLHFGELGQRLKKITPQFKAQRYGHKTLKSLMTKLGYKTRTLSGGLHVVTRDGPMH